MSQLPADMTSMGYEPPRNVQFSVFLDNRVGKLRELVGVFDGQALTLAGLSIHDSTEYAVIRLVTSRAELGRRLLQRYGFTFSETDVLIVELGAGTSLSLLCSLLLTAEVSIGFVYPLLATPRGLPAIVLDTDDRLLAAQLLQRKHFTLLAENDLGENATPGMGY